MVCSHREQAQSDPGRKDPAPVAHFLLRAQAPSGLPDGDGTGCQEYLVRDNLNQPHVSIATTEDITVLCE